MKIITETFFRIFVKYSVFHWFNFYFLLTQCCFEINNGCNKIEAGVKYFGNIRLKHANCPVVIEYTE